MLLDIIYNKCIISSKYNQYITTHYSTQQKVSQPMANTKVIQKSA